jgi:hypothetical protein
MIRFAICFSSVFFSYPLLGGADWEQIYRSQWANHFLKDQSNGTLTGLNQQHFSTESDRTDFVFACPGDSFMIGLSSEAQERPYDRQFRFHCVFLADRETKGRIEKTQKSCDDIPQAPYDSQQNPWPQTYQTKPGGSPGEVLACEKGKAFQGVASALYLDIDKDDRLYQATCCGMNQYQIAPIGDSCTRSQILGGESKSFHYQCPENTLVTQIETAYNKSNQDRTFQVTCCPLLPVPPSP